MSNAASADLIIAGGGPVGLCLAFLAGSAGLSVRVLEAETTISEDLRASTFHPPTLDMLAPSGIAAELIRNGLVCPHWQIRSHPSGERALFDLSVLKDETAHPYRLQCEQWKLSRALLSRLQGMENVEVRFGASFEGFEQTADGVAVTSVSPDGRREDAGRFLAGCDGARSVVRKGLGLSFDGLTYPETTLLVTTTFPFEDHLPGLSNVSYCWKQGGNFSLLRVPGRWRVSIYPREDLSIEEQLSEESIEASLQEIVPRAEGYEVLEKRAYRVHQRIVPRYAVGRVALAGDAAHLNSPAGGMGLNGGIHDAFVLAEALSDIALRGAPLSRLQRYDALRRPVAADQILAQADANRARMRETDPERRRAMLDDMIAITRDPARLKAHLMRSSMIEGIRQMARAAA